VYVKNRSEGLVVKITVKAFATFREILGQTGQLNIESPTRELDIKTLIEYLVEHLGVRFREEILDENGMVKKNVKILVNGRDIDFLNGVSTKLKDGDIVVFVPPVAGG